MIKCIKRQDLDLIKYDTCIENSIQSRIYALSWYLDIAADNWDVLVLDDYQAVMPIPWRKKMGVKYVYPPFWMIELGFFSLNDKVDSLPFFKVLFDKFKFVELRMNTTNRIQESKENLIDRNLQFISLNSDYNSIFKNYNRNRKRELVHAKKNDLIENWNDNPEKLISLFKENIGIRVKEIKENDYNKLLKLMLICLKKKNGDLLTVFDSNNNIVSAAFFLKYNHKVTQLVCVSDIKNRKNGAHTFFNDRAIFKYQPNFNEYNFGGSSMKSIANYYKSFGAETVKYQQVKYNNLPFLLKWFKK
ncbi:hypothetical protein [uncultured Polaribacter sp.]|uniref:hypothetical protein n=1 Tax=uncultured Polaribacter sp. TaxID=174711 RepID=UPI00261A5A26|nr:hypothetical protein [uncultured Polaribacter sp.]